jgi:hypothetical protein
VRKACEEVSNCLQARCNRSPPTLLSLSAFGNLGLFRHVRGIVYDFPLQFHRPGAPQGFPSLAMRTCAAQRADDFRKRVTPGYERFAFHCYLQADNMETAVIVNLHLIPEPSIARSSFAQQ